MDMHMRVVEETSKRAPSLYGRRKTEGLSMSRPNLSSAAPFPTHGRPNMLAGTLTAGHE